MRMTVTQILNLKFKMHKPNKLVSKGKNFDNLKSHA